ncbi:hypothetical protein AURDEDRAFT_177122 [Auricularia subglabra TFB-10046 SS5]|uniref:Uncharacterized protein n=1 Tax=Auricularia subglabra (strain TFB-10046 / SS5) TaxID=717982 RepID=J0WN63_AURST|nr:hypothetical protein AURDEDRAFT_177122 [Auricularia subglabra TFB-10046 SS5]
MTSSFDPDLPTPPGLHFYTDRAIYCAVDEVSKRAQFKDKIASALGGCHSNELLESDVILIHDWLTVPDDSLKNFDGPFATYRFIEDCYAEGKRFPMRNYLIEFDDRGLGDDFPFTHRPCASDEVTNEREPMNGDSDPQEAEGVGVDAFSRNAALMLHSRMCKAMEFKAVPQMLVNLSLNQVAHPQLPYPPQMTASTSLDVVIERLKGLGLSQPRPFVSPMDSLSERQKRRKAAIHQCDAEIQFKAQDLICEKIIRHRFDGYTGQTKENLVIRRHPSDLLAQSI